MCTSGAHCKRSGEREEEDYDEDDKDEEE